MDAVSNYLQYRGKCREFSEALIKEKPNLQLRLVRGHYYDPYWGRQPHWWCVSPSGTIHDPTALQFPSVGSGEYEEFNGICECDVCEKEMPEGEACVIGSHVYCSTECYAKDVGC